MTSMLPSTSSRLRQGPTHVTDTERCPTPCPNPTEVTRLRQLFLCCSRSGVSPSSRACSVLFPALQLSRAAVCAATELSVRCSQDLFDLQTPSVLSPDWRGELVVTPCSFADACTCTITITHTNCLTGGRAVDILSSDSKQGVKSISSLSVRHKFVFYSTQSFIVGSTTNTNYYCLLSI